MITPYHQEGTAGRCDRHDLGGTTSGTPTGAVGVHRHRNRPGDGTHDLRCER
jgi:hypothetical protein